jgi:hypothetical protein
LTRDSLYNVHVRAFDRNFVNNCYISWPYYNQLGRQPSRSFQFPTWNSWTCRGFLRYDKLRHLNLETTMFPFCHLKTPNS